MTRGGLRFDVLYSAISIIFISILNLLAVCFDYISEIDFKINYKEVIM